MPYISVAMCTYNGERLVKDQLASILAQTRLPDEMVICDDRSTDGTAGMLREFSRLSPFPARVIVNPQNLGVTRNYQQAMGQCTGDLIAFADQDDAWMPDKLEKAEAMFINKPTLGAVFSDAEVVGEGLRPLGYTLWQSIRFNARERCLARHNRCLDILFKYNIVSGSTLVFNARLYRGLVLPVPPYCLGDHWTALLCAAIGSLGMLEEPLVKYRKHPAQLVGPGGDGSIFGMLAREARKCVATGEYLHDFYNNRALELRQARALYSSAYERLLDSGMLSDKPGVAKKFEEKLAHLEAREQMAGKSRISRLPLLLAEILRLRYRRYSNGIAYMAGDLLA